MCLSSQADTEQADLEREKTELEQDADSELEELIKIYEARGVDRATATSVADQMMTRDALGAHARDELGLSATLAARPLQAAVTSALTFTAGAAAPLLIVLFVGMNIVVPAVGAVSLLCLAALGAIGAKAGGAPIIRSVVRVSFWGVAAMLVTAGVGWLFGAAVG